MRRILRGTYGRNLDPPSEYHNCGPDTRGGAAAVDLAEPRAHEGQDSSPGGFELRTLYRHKDGPNPGTVRRRKEVQELARQGLTEALRALQEGPAEMVGTAGFDTREDVLSLEPLQRQEPLWRARPPLFGQTIIQRQTIEERSGMDVAYAEHPKSGLDALIERRHERRVKEEGDRP